MRITLEQLSMTYPNGKRALDAITLSLDAPNLIGLLGPNGAGKTTLMKLLVAGLLPTSGSICIDETPLTRCENAWKSRLGYLPQSFGLYDELTVWQFLDYMAALKAVANPKRAIEEALDATHMTALRKSRIRGLSGGQRQRVGIAQALLGSPSFLIFDEPTVGLDPEERIHLRNLFSALAVNRLVILSTHIIEDVQSICNRLVVIDAGGIRFDGTPADIIQAAQGHVGVFEEAQCIDASGQDELRVTSRVNTARGVSCRVVARELPAFAHSVEPTLEDAYLYRIWKGDAA